MVAVPKKMGNDQIVDAIVGHGMFSFIDAFSGYHQIPMFQSDEEKQPSLHHMGYLQALIGRTVEVYIDNIVVKSETQDEHVQHLEETFCPMRAYNMKVYLAKCAFGISAGKFLGFMVT
ncbi:hypothetical protein CK203_103667 [Vitis vinifera]|uniref:Reverse transcriptase domain-containing protein n=1 Tax=Vitis vinifera TaxID=29760 RepID=A0A438DNE0_VITVI|nr:hypothetical protein CK203_103667 [Vitis vinifera]